MVTKESANISDPGEREAFLKAADDAAREVRIFCGTLTYTGAGYRKPWR